MTLEVLTSPALDGIQHGFFTRKGGASSGVFHGLNCGQASSDQDRMVEINRTRVAQAMDAQVQALVTIKQTHSPDVVTITKAPDTLLTGDAMVSNTPGLVLGILTADCQPVLLADRAAGVVGAVHAGWKGARDGVLENTIDAMEALGAHRADITAVVGPTISQRNYEVGPEFVDGFLQQDPESRRFFAPSAGDKAHFDLPAFGLWLLQRAGVGHAEWIGHCTYADEARFFSYRRATHRKEADYGRLISTIRL